MSESRQLAHFASTLTYEAIPARVIQGALSLLLDWAGSCLAGSGSRQAKVFQTIAETMGPGDGVSTIVGSTRTTSPYFAAMINAAASHVVEQDDLHNSSVFHPATVVFPPLLAIAERDGADARAFLCATVVGYETGIRVGEFLGQSHYRLFHTTATAGTIAAAMAVASLRGLDSVQTLHALGSAGTQAAGLWEFLGDASDSKQLHTAKAAADGLLAAIAAEEGLTGATKILEGRQGLGNALHGSGTRDQLTAGLGQRWALLETSFKLHASCRHTHPAADAMLRIMETHRPTLTAIDLIRVKVYQAAFDVLGVVKRPVNIHQSKFSMGFVLALIALYRRAGVAEFNQQALTDPRLLAIHDKVIMEVDSEIERRYPQSWCAEVMVEMKDGSRFSEYVDTPKGDPGNTLSKEELECKAHSLVAHYEAATGEYLDSVIETIWRLPDAGTKWRLFPTPEWQR